MTGEFCLAPRGDETLWSWVQRTRNGESTYFKHKIIASGILKGIQVPGISWLRNDPRTTADFDLDFGMESCEVLDLFSVLGAESRAGLMERFKPDQDWTIPYAARTAFCRHCITESLTQGSPYWKKSWAYVLCPICSKHLQPLSQIESPVGDRAWAAYRDVRKKFWKNVLSAPSIHTGRSGLLLELISKYGYRVQNFLNDAHLFKEVVVPRRNRKANSSDILLISKFLMKMFLFVCIPDDRPGIANHLFRNYRRHEYTYYKWHTWANKFEIGVLNAAPFERAISLVLIGIVLGMLSPDEWMLLYAVAYNMKYDFPHKIEELAFLSCMVDSRESYEHCRAQLYGLSADGADLIKDYLNAFEKKCISFGFSSRHAGLGSASLFLKWVAKY